MVPFCVSAASKWLCLSNSLTLFLKHFASIRQHLPPGFLQWTGAKKLEDFNRNNFGLSWTQTDSVPSFRDLAFRYLQIPIAGWCQSNYVSCALVCPPPPPCNSAGLAVKTLGGSADVLSNANKSSQKQDWMSFSYSEQLEIIALPFPPRFPRNQPPFLHIPTSCPWAANNHPLL